VISSALPLNAGVPLALDGIAAECQRNFEFTFLSAKQEVGTGFWELVHANLLTRIACQHFYVTKAFKGKGRAR
jgi:hypothetical protein